MSRHRILTTCFLLGTSLTIPACRIVNGQVDYSWVGEQFTPPMEDSVVIDRGTGALDIPASEEIRPVTASTPAPAALPKPLPEKQPQDSPGFFASLFGQSSGDTGTTAPGGSTPQYLTYTVVAGDTLSGIARRHGTRTATLIQVNKLDTTRPLQINQKLLIPTSGAPVAPAPQPAATPTKLAPKASPAPRQNTGFFSRLFGQSASGTAAEAAKPYFITYTVVAGDTLSGIARRHGTTARYLIELNKIDTTRPLQINQKLQIPSSTPPPVRKRRSSTPPPTPQEIAPQPAVSTAPETAPAPGTTNPAPQPVSVILPAAESAPQPVPTPQPAISNTYTVRQGDTLYAIARKHNLSPDSLMQANGLTLETAGKLQVGDTIKLPASTPPSTPQP